MLARDHVHLTIGGRSYTLRPSVQAAIRLEYAYGMAAVLKAVHDGSATIMAQIIRETADMDRRLADILDDLCQPTMAVNMGFLREALAGLVLSMHGVDPDAEHKPSDPDAEHKPSEPKPGAKEVTFREHLTQLYAYGTGWLGWTPAVTLASTPSEINEAFKGHVEKLKAIHGVKDAEPEPVDLDTKAKAIFGGLAQRFRDRQPKAA